MSSDSFNVGVNMCVSVRMIEKAGEKNDCHKVSQNPSVDLHLNFIMNEQYVAFSVGPKI